MYRSLNATRKNLVQGTIDLLLEKWISLPLMPKLLMVKKTFNCQLFIIDHHIYLPHNFFQFLGEWITVVFSLSLCFDYSSSSFVKPFITASYMKPYHIDIISNVTLCLLTKNRLKTILASRWCNTSPSCAFSMNKNNKFPVKKCFLLIGAFGVGIESWAK